jgi:oligoribonuclease (3'-5' exoribonuclease)
MNLKPYISLDIETTGLNIEKAKILEIGAVYDDGIKNIHELQTYSVIIDWPFLDWAEIPALVLNKDLLTNIYTKKGNCKSPKDAFDGLIHFINQFKSGKNIQIAGKNVANFDIPILLNNMSTEQSKLFENIIQHRTIDVGSIYYPIFGYNPSLDEINKYIQYKPVSHKALEDAINVVYAIRKSIVSQ